MLVVLEKLADHLARALPAEAREVRDVHRVRAALVADVREDRVGVARSSARAAARPRGRTPACPRSTSPPSRWPSSQAGGSSRRRWRVRPRSWSCPTSVISASHFGEVRRVELAAFLRPERAANAYVARGVAPAAPHAPPAPLVRRRVGRVRVPLLERGLVGRGSPVAAKSAAAAQAIMSSWRNASSW